METNFTLIRKAITTLLIPLFLNAVAADAKKPTPAPAPAPTAAAKSSGVKFRPPATDAPAVRVTGGSRGTGNKTVTLDVLAPDSVGLTTQEQPSLYWFQSQPANAKFELTVVQENKVKPVMQMSIDRASKAGIQRLKLSDFNAKLSPDIEYQWVIALITDADNRSTDLIASGVIKRVAPPAGLTGKSGKAGAAAYADAGIWYDALSAISDAIDANPNDKSLRQSRADLLKQVGLKAAAQYEESVQ